MAWLIRSLLYVLLIGGLGITGKLALRTLSWPDLILWTTLGYVAVSIVLLAIGQTAIRLTTGTGWAVLSGALAISGLIMLYVALGGDRPARSWPSRRPTRR